MLRSLSKSRPFRTLLLPLLCSLALVGCKPPGPRKPSVPTPDPVPAPVVPDAKPDTGTVDEVFDETLVARVVTAFTGSGLPDYQTRAKDYAALYLAASRVVAVDKTIATKAQVVAQIAGTRDLMGLLQGKVPELSKIVGEETDKIADGDLTDETRSKFVTLFKHLYEGSRRAASK